MHQHPIGPDHSVNKVVTRNSSSFFVSFNPRCTWDCSTLACLIYTIQYPFKTNILRFLIRFNLQPANAYYIWKVRAIYHRFDGILPKNPSINLVSWRRQRKWYSPVNEKMLFMAIWGRNNLIFTKTERKELNGKKCKNTQIMLLYMELSTFCLRSICEKNRSVFISWDRVEK